MCLGFSFRNPSNARSSDCVEICFGSFPNDDRGADFTSFGFTSGWDLLSIKVDDSSQVVGSLDVIPCSYSALETNFAANIFADRKSVV